MDEDIFWKTQYIYNYIYMRHMGLIENGVPQKIIMFYRHFPH